MTPTVRTIAFSLLAMLVFAVIALVGGLCDILRKPNHEANKEENPLEED